MDKKHSSSRKLGLSTRVIHEGQHPCPMTGAVSPAIFQTSTFAFESAAQGAARFAGEEEGYIYTRMGNPTIDKLQQNIAALEGGAGGLATASGMAALCTNLFSLLHAGDHIIATESLYGPSRVVVERDFSRFGVEYSFIDTSDPANVEKAIRPNTKLLFIETPANPTIIITDIEACTEIAKKHSIITIVDNTFCSPILQRPLEWGADIVMHSMTKFINGHSDVVAGMIIPKEKEMLARIRKGLHFLGGTMDPHQAWLVLRGVKTLHLRVMRCQENAIKMAHLLEDHPAVEWVRYPGLESHPHYAVAQKQQDGPGALISFGLKGGVEAGRKLLETVTLATLAVSLGGIETLIQHPASMTHATMNKRDRLAAGITDGLVRISVGCEDGDDLLSDMKKALDGVR
jgi:methionine-gamma-lyase